MEANIEIINEHGQTIFVDELNGKKVSIGRDRENDVVIPSNKASRRHGLFYKDYDVYFFRDTSRNGSGVRDFILRDNSHKLDHGDVITIGDIKVLFRYGPLDENQIKVQKTMLAVPVLNLSGKKKFGFEYFDPDNRKHEVVPISDDYFTIGSGEGDNIIEPSLEARHGEVIILNDRPYIQCKHHGITLNGIDLSSDPEVLQEGDIIKAGRKKLQFKIYSSDSITNYKYRIVTKAPCMKKVIEQIDQCCRFDEPVMIFGETGTGKELVARAIHYASGRSEYPFVAVNCAEIDNNLAGSILFGHDKGAFTGAESKHIGLLEQADHGTLFLDELGELSYEIQAKLLRAIQFGEIRPIGGLKTKKINIRVVTATHKVITDPKLRNEIKFRDDLYYRLCIKSIYIPALRDRQEDIPLLMDHILEIAKVKYPFFGNVTFAEKAYEAAKNIPWYGNIRELFAQCMGAFIECDGKKIESILPSNLLMIPSRLMKFYRAYMNHSDEVSICKELSISRASYYRQKDELIARKLV